MSELVHAKNISLIRSGKQILDRVSLSVSSGDFITIIGPNGAGKTTLLKCLMGVLKPDSGTVERTSDSVFGYVPQRLNTDTLMPLTVQRFVKLNSNVSKEQLQSAVELTYIQDSLKKNLYELSGGEMQRALFARALLRNPSLMILDEPAQNMDVTSQLHFYELIEKCHKEKKDEHIDGVA